MVFSFEFSVFSRQLSTVFYHRPRPVKFIRRQRSLKTENSKLKTA